MQFWVCCCYRYFCCMKIQIENRRDEQIIYREWKRTAFSTNYWNPLWRNVHYLRMISVFGHYNVDNFAVIWGFACKGEKKKNNGWTNLVHRSIWVLCRTVADKAYIHFGSFVQIQQFYVPIEKYKFLYSFFAQLGPLLVKSFFTLNFINPVEEYMYTLARSFFLRFLYHRYKQWIFCTWTKFTG